MKRAALAVVVLAWAGSASGDPVWGCDGVGYGGAAGAGWTDLVLMVPSSQGAIQARMTLPEGKTFADLPVCADLDGDGVDEIITVEADVLLGPQIAVYAKTRGRVAAGLPLGNPGATLRVVGAGGFGAPGVIAALDGTGQLRLWQMAPDRLAPRGALAGYAPGGGVRDCGTGAELLLPRADGSAIDAVRVEAQGPVATRIGNGIGDLPRLLACEGG